MDMLLRLIDLNGVATRGQAWAAFAALIAAAAGLFALDTAVPAYAPFARPLFGLVFVVFICTMVRRLHDTGVSGYWSLTLLIPGLGILTQTYCLFWRTGRRFANGHPVARLVGSLGLAALFSLFVLRVFWTPFWIPSESMKPTLLVGDYLVVRHLEASRLQRGDVAVFRHPVRSAPFIMRLIGLPGDTVEMRAGQVVLNGQPVPQTPDGVFEEVMEPQGPMAARPRCENGPVGEGGLCTKSRFRETLPSGATHPVLNIDAAGHADTTEVFVVPAGYLFFLGDNRDNSMDSRYSQAVGGLGFVPVDAVIGRADRILFSAAGQGLFYVWTWRAGRAFGLIE